MRISNIANKKADKTLELEIIGTLEEVEGFGAFTEYTADFVEDRGYGEYSITIMGRNREGKKDFKGYVVAELKEFRKKLKQNI